jgi:hypothetical protein
MDNLSKQIASLQTNVEKLLTEMKANGDCVTTLEKSPWWRKLSRVTRP